MDPRVAAGNRCRSTMGADVAAALGGSGCCGLVLRRQAAMARSTHRILSALADRCRAVGFVFAAAGCDLPILYFVAQMPVRRRRITGLFFCFCLFPGGIAAGTGTD